MREISGDIYRSEAVWRVFYTKKKKDAKKKRTQLLLSISWLLTRSKDCENLELVCQRALNVNIDQDSREKLISSAGCFTREAHGKTDAIITYCIDTTLHLSYTHKMCLHKNHFCWECKRHKGMLIYAMWAWSKVLLLEKDN